MDKKNKLTKADEMNKRIEAIRRVVILLGVLLGICMIRVIYISFWSELGLNVNNQRFDILENKILRGNFYDRNGVPLTENVNGVRSYLYNGRYNSTIGYLDYGEYGLEKDYSKILLSPDYSFFGILKNIFTKEKFTGLDIHLTLDNNLQSVAENSFKGKKGACVIIEPDTGKIRSIYSSPAFNPNIGQSELDSLLSRTDKPLLNRATQGLYPPGSIFKILPAYGLMEKFPKTYQDITYDCTGEIIVDGHIIECYDHHAHGILNLTEAFKYSCNTYFINLREYISYKELGNIAKRFLFNTQLSDNILVNPSRFDKKDENLFSRALTYIGQGRTLVTPFHMAMIASAIANDGILMKPYIIERIEEKSSRSPKEDDVIFDTWMANNLQNLMIGVVNGGTGKPLQSIPATVGIKTGTAENSALKPHSWVIGFAQDREDSIAFAIIVENQEGAAINISKNIIINFLENNRN